MKSCDIIRSCCDQSITVMNHISYEVVTPPATKPHINNDVFVLMDCRPHLRLPQSSFHGHNTADENAANVAAYSSVFQALVHVDAQFQM